MKILKRFMGCALAIMLAFSIVACKDTQSSALNSSSDNTSSSSVEEPSDQPKKSLLDTIDALQSSEFADSSLTDTAYGLSDEGAVGVIEGEYNQTKYPIPADDVFQGEVIHWSEYSFDGDDFAKFKDILKYAKESNAKGTKVKLNMPENTKLDFDISAADTGHFAVWIEALNGFYLQGNGCTFNLQYPDLEWRGFIYFFACDDVWLENFTIEYEVPNAISGKILSYDTENLSVTIAVDKEFNEFISRLKNNKGIVWSYLEYNKITKIPQQGGNYIADEASFYGYEIEGTAEQGYQFTLHFADGVRSAFKATGVGNYVHIGFSYYVYNCLTFDLCGSSYLENITMHYSPAMGLVGTNNEHLYINRFQIKRKAGSNLLLTTAADGVHIVQQHGTVDITNCYNEYSQDDAYNIKSGVWYEFSGYDVVNKEITISKKSIEIPAPRVGDVIEIYDYNTFEYKAGLTVVEVKGTPLAYTLKVKESIAKLGMGDWGACVASNVTTAQLTFRNNIIQNKRNRGILVELQNAVVENNTFRNVAHGSIMIMCFLDQFNEATVPRNVSVKNNKLINNNYQVTPQGDILVSALSSINQLAPSGTIRNIYIENNFIALNGAAGVCFIGGGDSTIKNNLFYNNARVSLNEDCAIDLRNSNNLEITGNYCLNTIHGDDFQGVVPSGSTNSDTIKLVDNTNLELSFGSFVKGTIYVKKVASSALSVDGDLSDWNGIGNDIEILGASKEDSTKATEEEYAAHFGVNMAKVAWDDKGIYVAFDIRDDELTFKKQSNFWFGDCFEFFMTSVTNMPNADMKLYKNLGNSIQLACVPSWDQGYALIAERTSDDIYNQPNGLLVKVGYTAQGYAGEFFLPFTLFPQVKAMIDEGMGVPLNFVFADAERQGLQRVQLANVPHWVESMKKQTAKTPDYIFVEE